MTAQRHVLEERRRGRVLTAASSFAAGLLSLIEDSLGLRVRRVQHNGCLGPGCPPRGCRNVVRLSGELLSHVTTARASYITPLHSWESVCPCNGDVVI